MPQTTRVISIQVISLVRPLGLDNLADRVRSLTVCFVVFLQDLEVINNKYLSNLVLSG